MKTKENNIQWISVVGMLTLLLVSSGCSQKKERDSEQPPDFAVSCIAVAPAVSVPPVNSELLSKIEKKELEDGLYFLNKFLTKHFLSRKDVRLFSDGKFKDKGDATPSLERAKRYGDRFSCNAVLETTLHRYKERVGGEMTAKEPASVAFEYRLLGLPNGQMLCQDSFSAQQQSLLENILSFRDGTGGTLTWLTAKEFMSKGLRNRLGKCSYLAQ